MKEYIVKDMTGEFEDKDYPELIRCKDCKYYQFGKLINDTRFCYRLFDNNGNHVGYNFSPNDFCSRAERKEE